MGKEQTDWKRMIFKGNKVWLATGQNNKPILKNGKVLIKYQLDQNYEYWVHEKGVMPLNSLQSEKPEKKRLKKNRAGTETERKTGFDTKTVSDNTIFIYTDGASSGNPGPSGIGVLLRFKNHEKEISKNIGDATNNIAELEAIKTALLELKHYDYPVRLFTDSSYACGVLTLGWKAKKNKGLISSIKRLISKFSDLQLIKVKGHDGFEGNEKADFLATSAIKKEENRGKI
ncbi:MAG: RNase H family protein [Thermodesulfobacteriota bacterium]|nr:RNase H family protein [Thermodesulfobacteriota bacterium]